MFRRNNQAKFGDLTATAYQSDYIKHKQPHFLVDVRTPGEFRGGHLPNSVNIPLNELGKRLDEVPRDVPVVVVCASGNRSRSGASQIAGAGVTDVYNLQGGLMAWMSQGFKTVR